KRAYCLKTQPATGETYPKSDLFNKAHITLNFDGADIAELPGTVHLYGEPPQIIQPGDQISFYPNCH
ncbi:PTS glucitol/sorbitol transporter subunit IIA, partial [Klebsiella pneumoniae]|uniref:PTS glucitol/sorbitol transporter subunit IIA n=2 Tax=Klebsiella pneumoniae TaxID=573 RepID=UPI00209C21B5